MGTDRPSIPSNVCPPFPGVTPATTFVPYSIIWQVWNEPSRPVMPCTASRVSLSMRIAMVYAFAICTAFSTTSSMDV